MNVSLHSWQYEALVTQAYFLAFGLQSGLLEVHPSGFILLWTEWELVPDFWGTTYNHRLCPEKKTLDHQLWQRSWSQTSFEGKKFRGSVKNCCQIWPEKDEWWPAYRKKGEKWIFSKACLQFFCIVYPRREFFKGSFHCNFLGNRPHWK